MTPLEEAIFDIICCVRKQTNSQKVKTLRPHSKKHYYIANNECIHFLSCPLHNPENTRQDFSIPMSELFGTIRTKQYIYIYCYENILFFLNLKNNRLYVWAPDKTMQKKIYMSSYNLWINTVWHKLKLILKKGKVKGW